MARLTRKPHPDSAVVTSVSGSTSSSAVTHADLSQGSATLSSAEAHAHGLRHVLLDGYILGLECQRLVLWEFMAADFAECYLETKSGSLYRLFRQGKELIMAQALGHGQSARATTVPGDIILEAVLKVGEPFNYGSGFTVALTHITIVTRTTFLEDQPTPEDAVLVALERTDGHMSNVRQRFKTLVTREA